MPSHVACWSTVHESKKTLQYIQLFPWHFPNTVLFSRMKREKLCVKHGGQHAHFPSVWFFPLLILERKITAKSSFCGEGSAGFRNFCNKKWLVYLYLIDMLSASNKDDSTNYSGECEKQSVWNCQLEMQWVLSFKISIFLKKNLVIFGFFQPLTQATGVTFHQECEMFKWKECW